MTAETAVLSGELTFKTARAWLEQAPALIAGESLDLAGVTRTDSAGLALLLELSRRARAAGRTLRIVNADEQVQRLLRFFGLSDVLTLGNVPTS